VPFFAAAAAGASSVASCGMPSPLDGFRLEKSTQTLRQTHRPLLLLLLCPGFE
jgi:hypothetical protein